MGDQQSQEQHIIISCIFGNKFNKVYPAIAGKRSIFFSNNPDIASVVKKQGWEFRLVKKHPLSSDYRISSIQSKYIKFLQFFDEFPDLKDMEKITYFDHKFYVQQSHLDWIEDNLQQDKAILIRNESRVKLSIIEEAKEAMLQNRYAETMVPTIEWITTLVKQRVISVETRIVNTGFITYQNYNNIMPLLNDVYSKVWLLAQPECQIIWACLSQLYSEHIQRVEWEELNPLWQAP
ncbi:MAG: hypothetical protein HQL69_19285 [Magnetococcales bacterium]|nr:hypothetical protein [Magnetococcales bacterium]